MINDITWMPWLIANMFYVVTLSWASYQFGGSMYGKLWSKFAMWQTIFAVSLAILSATLVFNLPFTMESIRAEFYSIIVFTSIMSTWYSIRMLRLEKN